MPHLVFSQNFHCVRIWSFFKASSTVGIDMAKPLHPSFYTDKKYAPTEIEHVFGTQWFAAAHTGELAEAGDVKVVEVGGTSILLTRDRSGEINAFYNVCRHRGSRICKESQKACKQLVCPYHWWAYRLDGSLKSAPPATMPKEKKENLSLERVPGLEVFAGIVFLNQTPNPPPLIDTLGDLPEKLERYDLDAMEFHDTKTYDIKGDWKLIAENFVDFYHINSVHPALSKFSKVEDHVPYQGRGQYVGFATAPLTDCGGPGDAHKFNRFPRINAREASAGLFIHIFPNISVTIYPHSVYTLMTMPSTVPGHTVETLTLLMAPGARKHGDCPETYAAKRNALMDFVTEINDEDVVAIEFLQRGLENAKKRNIQGEFVPQYDWPLHRFQNMLLSSMDGSKIDESKMPELCRKFEESVTA